MILKIWAKTQNYLGFFILINYLHSVGFPAVSVQSVLLSIIIYHFLST